jgi:hypothetical protein
MSKKVLFIVSNAHVIGPHNRARCVFRQERSRASAKQEGDLTRLISAEDRRH